MPKSVREQFKEAEKARPPEPKPGEWVRERNKKKITKIRNVRGWNDFFGKWVVEVHEYPPFMVYTVEPFYTDKDGNVNWLWFDTVGPADKVKGIGP